LFESEFSKFKNEENKRHPSFSGLPFGGVLNLQFSGEPFSVYQTPNCKFGTPLKSVN